VLTPDGDALLLRGGDYSEFGSGIFAFMPLIGEGPGAEARPLSHARHVGGAVCSPT